LANCSTIILIDSILNGFPVPKLSLYQKTDLRSRRTTKEIVDGQQRSSAILAFFNNSLRITSKGRFLGKNYNDLTEEEQQKFLDYQLSVDIFVDATESDIRELFRRMNSYNIPLNGQEKRHSTYQGSFKWFILELSTAYSQTLKEFGTFSENQLARMEDSKFLADICIGLTEGIVSASEQKIDKIYKIYDENFPIERQLSDQLQSSFNLLIELDKTNEIGEELTKKYQLYCLLLALIHIRTPIEALQDVYKVESVQDLNIQRASEELSILSEALASKNDRGDSRLRNFILNSSKTTDRQLQRKARFIVICEALRAL